jgi:hypothetical protein
MKMDDTSATADVSRLKSDHDKGGGGGGYPNHNSYNDNPRSSS